MVDWGGKVAAWLAAVAGVSATLAALIATVAKQPLHGGIRALFAALVIIAAVSFLALLPTGPRALWTAWRNRKPVAKSSPALPPLPVDVRIVPEVDGDRLRLLVRNQGPRGMFTARVTGILDTDGGPAPTRQSWAIPWLDDDPIAPADLPCSDARTLDFARFDAGESRGWDKRASWWFVTRAEPVGVMYKPVRRDKKELADCRYVVTVRIIRTEPSEGYVDRQFSIGVTSNAA